LRKKILIRLLLICLIHFVCLTASAQNTFNQPVSLDQKLKPIEVDYTTLGGLRYFNDNTFLSSYKDFGELIYPLRDFETIRLLKKSESSATKAELFGIVGFAALAAGLAGLLTTSTNQQTPFWLTAIGGGISIDIGGLFQTEAQTAKFNCVQRYNRFARGEEQVLPEAPQDEKSLLNFDKNSNLQPEQPITKKKPSP
jgi:hypothetical protein